MAALDLPSFLATLATPRTRTQALVDGHLFDVTRAAGWCGFHVAASMTVAAWEETVGVQTERATAKERADAGKRLYSVWAVAARAVAAYRDKGLVLPSIGLQHAAASDPRRMVRLVLLAGVDAGKPYVTLALEGES